MNKTNCARTNIAYLVNAKGDALETQDLILQEIAEHFVKVYQVKDEGLNIEDFEEFLQGLEIPEV